MFWHWDRLARIRGNRGLAICCQQSQRLLWCFLSEITCTLERSDVLSYAIHFAFCSLDLCFVYWDFNRFALPKVGTSARTKWFEIIIYVLLWRDGLCWNMRGSMLLCAVHSIELFIHLFLDFFLFLAVSELSLSIEELACRWIQRHKLLAILFLRLTSPLISSRLTFMGIVRSMEE